MNDIQKTIGDYLKNKTQPNEHDLICFVGMLETGEATADDFAAVGGVELAVKVADEKSSMESQRFDAEMGYVS